MKEYDWAHKLVDTQPGALLHEDVDLIEELVGGLPKTRPVGIVELGARNGITTLSVLCARAEDVRIITMAPAEEGLRWPKTVAKNISRSEDWQGMIAGLDESASKIATRSIDLLIVDTHSGYSELKRLLKSWLSKIRKGGFVWIHDYDSSTFPGIKRVVNAAVKAEVLEEVEVKGHGWAGKVI